MTALPEASPRGDGRLRLGVVDGNGSNSKAINEDPQILVAAEPCRASTTMPISTAVQDCWQQRGRRLLNLSSPPSVRARMVSGRAHLGPDVRVTLKICGLLELSNMIIG